MQKGSVGATRTRVLFSHVFSGKGSSPGSHKGSPIIRRAKQPQVSMPASLCVAYLLHPSVTRARFKLRQIMMNPEKGLQCFITLL